MWPFLLQVGPFVILLVLALTVGGFVERAHFKRLERRESQLRDMLVTDLRTFPPNTASSPCGLVTGEVVIASDYFKSFAAALRSMVGGELRSFETLMERARREALVRMLESARRLGAGGVINVRFATSNIGSQRRKRNAAMVEMYAYGTAVRFKEQPRG